ncbi:MAG: hypothetical protein MUQ00_13040, partial [Candidatus Aminicenantes bacterium]|nr:hypothetical protein [Candidatus Aminicenantes bacterium]
MFERIAVEIEESLDPGSGHRSLEILILRPKGRAKIHDDFLTFARYESLMVVFLKALGNDAASFPEPASITKGDGQGVGRNGDMRRVEDRRKNIDVAHDLPDLQVGLSVFYDERDMGLFRVQAIAVSLVAPLSELLTVIRSDNDKGILVKIAPAQFFEKFADLLVSEPDFSVIEAEFLLNTRRVPTVPERFLKE